MFCMILIQLVGFLEFERAVGYSTEYHLITLTSDCIKMMWLHSQIGPPPGAFTDLTSRIVLVTFKAEEKILSCARAQIKLLRVSGVYMSEDSDEAERWLCVLHDRKL